MAELSLWQVRPATAREKRDALLPTKADLNAVLSKPGRLLALATRQGIVLWLDPYTVYTTAEVEALLTVRSLEPLTADPDLTKLPTLPPKRSRDRRHINVEVRRVRLRIPRFNIPGM